MLTNAPQVIWLTGLSGSGKSTLAKALERSFNKRGIKAFTIDGDVLRAISGHDLGFSKEDRSKNVMRAVTLAQEKLQQGWVVIVAMISPFIKDRENARSQFMPSQFKEVYVSTPLSECEKRDPKGLYKQTRAGLILDMTGINSPYEPPPSPDIVINTEDQSIETSVKMITQKLLDDQIPYN
jgi:adenylyl-sulfate kinase